MTRATDTSRVTVEVSKVGEGSAPSRKHVNSLDGVRGIAILLVLMRHLLAMGVWPQNRWLVHRLIEPMAIGWSGVDLFFVLSGFLITGILLDTREASNRGKSFYTRRVLRIFPLYYAVVLGTLIACVVLRNHWWVSQVTPSSRGWISYVFYLHNWWMPLKEPQAHLVLLGHFWSLGVEEQFYLLWPACVWAFPRKTLVSICGVGCVTALALRWSCMTLSPSLGFFVYMNTFTRMDSLLAGAFCAIAVRDADLLRRVRKPILFAGLTAGAAFCVLAVGTHEIWDAGYYTMVYGYSLVAIIGAAFVLSAYLNSGTRSVLDHALSFRGLTAFGKYSYGIYVYQSFVQNAAVVRFSSRPWRGRSIKYSLLVSIAWFIVPFVIAFFSYHLFEKRFLRLKRFFKPKLQEPSVPRHVAAHA